MADSKLKIDLDKAVDKNGKNFYIGRLEAPIDIVCKDGVSFMIFISEEGNEQLQICSFKKKEDTTVYTKPLVYKSKG